MNESCHTYERVMSHMRTIHVTHMNESCHTYERVLSQIGMSHTYNSVMSRKYASFTANADHNTASKHKQG